MMGETDNMRRALETIRDLTGADVEQGPEIAETALEAVDHFAALRASKPEVEKLIEALPPERHEAETRQIGDDAGPASASFDAGWNEYRRKALRRLASLEGEPR